MYMYMYVYLRDRSDSGYSAPSVDLYGWLVCRQLAGGFDWIGGDWSGLERIGLD